MELPTTGKMIQVFRVNKDCGNVACKNFLEQVAVPDPAKLNEIFALTSMTAEKAGGVIEFWLGALDIAAMAHGTVDIFPPHVNPAEYYNGLERALKTFGQMSRSTSTMNDKRKGSFDCSLQGAEATEVMSALNTIVEYKDPSLFNCMQEFEASAALFEYYQQRKATTGEDVPMEEADSTTGDDVTCRPGMAEAESGEKNSPQAAEESARSSKQIVADAIGNIYSVAEGVSVCMISMIAKIRRSRRLRRS